MVNGYILVHRKIDSGKYHDNLLAIGLWTWVLLQANWKDNYWHGELIPRGSFITSISGIATKFRVDRKTIRKYLEDFEKEGMILLKRDNRRTLIEVVNYAKYQDLSLWCGQQTGQQGGQLDGQQTGQLDGHNLKKVKNIKKVKKENIEKSEEWFNEFWDAYPKKVEKKRAHDKFLQIIKTEEQFKEVMNGLNLTVIAKYQNEPDLKYILNPLTFLNGERWNDEPYQLARLKPQTVNKSNVPDYIIRQKEGKLSTTPPTNEALAKAKELQQKLMEEQR